MHVDMTDQITLTIPSRTSYTGVATLVLGGIGSRLELSYERMDDLQLAVVSVLEARGDEDVTVEVEAAQERVTISVGPLVEGSGSDQALGEGSRSTRRLGRTGAPRRPRVADASADAQIGIRSRRFRSRGKPLKTPLRDRRAPSGSGSPDAKRQFSEISSTIRPVDSAWAVRDTSAWARMPTNRPSSTTGSRRTCFSAMR